MKIKGKVSRIFHSMESGFKILVLEISKNSAIPEKYRNPDFPLSISAVGNLKNAKEEYVIEVTGEWERRENGKYWPWQFKVENYTVCAFDTPLLLTEMIGNLNNFGISRAKRMVEAYGTDIVNVLENEPASLYRWGKSPAEINELSRDFKKYHVQVNLNAFLSKYGVDEQAVDEIQEKWGLNAVVEIQRNPYILCSLKIVQFKTADKIAKDFGFSFDYPNRVDAVLPYVLNEYAGLKGHTFLNRRQLSENCNAFLKENSAVKGSLHKQHIENSLARCLAKGDIVIDGERVYSKQRFESENAVSDILTSRAEMKP